MLPLQVESAERQSVCVGQWYNSALQGSDQTLLISVRDWRQGETQNIYLPLHSGIDSTVQPCRCTIVPM